MFDWGSSLGSTEGYRREAKLRFPISFKVNNSNLIWSDGIASFQVDMKRLEQCNLRGPDPDGFVHFEILEASYKRQTRENGYELFDTKQAEGGPGVYDYFKRDSDLSYCYQVRMGNKTSARHDLGSLKDPESKISRLMKLFSRTEPIAKSDLWEMDLPSGLKSGRVFKSVIDILLREGFLKTTVKVSDSGRELDGYLRTEKTLSQ